ncbi:MAG: 16S rRNA (adenine(1518)-N(6)/adenine(1519)-N(6))-dimethyltransferase RsmA [Patescibacteria group bacterium]|nr:ribosomal RNA small subunit methyltransferase A [Patescibacteria group bacterium]
MDLTNRSTLTEVLKKHNLWAKKRFGQNFLTNRGILEKIIKTGEIKKTDHVIEVGPGLGTLTLELEKYAKRVTAIEADKYLIPILKEHLKKAKIVHMDALKFTPPATKYKVIANIPYNITSPLLTHFLTAKKRPEKIVFLVQKEVAEKICAKEGNLNVLAINVQIFGKPRIVAKVSPGSFHPAPKVDSAILEIKVFEKPLVEDFENFIKIVKAGFSQKRKKLINSLSSSLKIPTKELEGILGKYKDKRAQALSITDWTTLLKPLRTFDT